MQSEESAGTSGTTVEDSAQPVPDVTPSGSGYRAVMKRDGAVVWSCPHVHFTEHSARNCPSVAGAKASAS